MASWAFVALVALVSMHREGIRVASATRMHAAAAAPRRRRPFRGAAAAAMTTSISRRGSRRDADVHVEARPPSRCRRPSRGAAAVACRRRAAARRMPARSIDSGVTSATDTRGAHFSASGVDRPFIATDPAPLRRKMSACGRPDDPSPGESRGARRGAPLAAGGKYAPRSGTDEPGRTTARGKDAPRQWNTRAEDALGTHEPKRRPEPKRRRHHAP